MEFVFVTRSGDYYFFAQDRASAMNFANCLAEELQVGEYLLFETGVRL